MTFQKGDWVIGACMGNGPYQWGSKEIKKDWPSYYDDPNYWKLHKPKPTIKIKIMEKATHKIQVFMKGGANSSFYVFGDNYAIDDSKSLMSKRLIWKFRHLHGVATIRTKEISSILVEKIQAVSNPLDVDDHYDDPCN